MWYKKTICRKKTNKDENEKTKTLTETFRFFPFRISLPHVDTKHHAGVKPWSFKCRKPGDHLVGWPEGLELEDSAR